MIFDIHLVVSCNPWDREPGEKEDGYFGAKDGFRALIVERHVLKRSGSVSDEELPRFSPKVRAHTYFVFTMHATGRHEGTRAKNLPVQGRGTCHKRHDQKVRTVKWVDCGTRVW